MKRTFTMLVPVVAVLGALLSGSVTATADVGVRSGPSFRGAEPGRNHANIVWTDSTNGRAFGIPDPPDNGIQDGNWHELPGNPNGYYRPHYGTVSVGFVFDAPGADPGCLTRWDM